MIHRAARRVLTAHGAGALSFCESRARERLRAGDSQAFCLWFRIRAVVEAQQLARPGLGRRLN
ncbi:hypothetical protein [Zavarzinia sp. CC-PAN008]|uniref:hypothetical protein n=1 Tax=Zavarzinia sp. CC-PAN008 TaxID=3243332 RepID=UPI003F748594